MLINSFRFAVVSSYDTDAQTYINAVEAADAAAGASGGLETATKDAINAFVVDCKLDGIWTAIKASCILAGARTLAGALVPLVGAAPTNVGGNFVSGDYNRKTGLVGNGSSKYLNSNRASNADPQNSKHLGLYVSTGDSSSTSTRYYLGGGNAGFSGMARASGTNQLIGYASSGTNAIQVNAQGNTTGFKGIFRNSSSSVSIRTAGSTTSAAQTSAAETTATSLAIFAYIDSSGVNAPTNARIAFYSIGESLDLAKLDTRVTALITAINAAF